MLAQGLADRGLTQNEIAAHLGVTQAAVSKYVAGEVTVEDRFRDDARMQETVERIADGFASGAMDGYEALADLLHLVRVFEDRGPICEVHEEAMPALQGLGCDLCVRGYDQDLGAERAVLATVRRAARVLADTPGAVEHIPNVGTNIGMALPDATTELEIAAIPGRIHHMRGRVLVPSDPEFGASHHVATTILTAMRTDPASRAALNLATTDPLLDATREHGIEPIEFDPEYEDRAARLHHLFTNHGKVPRVIYHRGAYGIEPITYLLDTDAETTARLAADLITTATTTLT